MFERLLEMSMQASILILVVLLVRLIIRKMPKGYSYVLWLLVLFRLLCPVFVESSFSLQPQVFIAEREVKVMSGAEVMPETEDMPETGTVSETEIIPEGDGMVEKATAAAGNVEAGNTVIENAMESDMDTEFISEADKLSIAEVAHIVWAGGIVVMLGIHLWQYIVMKRKVKMAVRERDNIWLCDRVESPFVMGAVKPCIYLPFGLDESEKQYVLCHEQMHIKHKDPLVRMVGVAALCLHWWNPLVWVAIRLMNRDMEMFCDEAALKGADAEERKAYSEALLHFAIRRSHLSVTLGFGESDTEKRVKNIMFWKRPGVLVCIGVVTVILLCVVCFLTVPKNGGNKSDTLGAADAEMDDTESTEMDDAETENTEAEVVPAGTYVISASEFEKGANWVRAAGEYADDTAYYAFVHDFDKDAKEEAFIVIGEEVHAIPTGDSEMMIFGDLWYASGTGKPKLLVSDIKVGNSQQLLSLEDDYILITYYKDLGWDTDMYLVQENQVSKCFSDEKYSGVTLKYLENDELIMTWSFTDEVFRELVDDFAGQNTKEYPYTVKGTFYEVVPAEEMTEQAFVDACDSEEILDQIRMDYDAEYLQFLRRENGTWHVNIGDDVGYNYEFFCVTYEESEDGLVEVKEEKGYYRMNPISKNRDFCELVRVTRAENRAAEAKEDFWRRGRWFGRSEDSIQKCYDVLQQADVCEQDKYQIADYYIMDIDENMEDDYLVMLGRNDWSYEYTDRDYEDYGKFLIFINGEQVYCYNDLDYSFTCHYGFMMDFCTDFDNDGHKELFLEAINGGNGGNDIMVLKYKTGNFEQMPIFTRDATDTLPYIDVTIYAGKGADEYEIYCANMSETIILKGHRMSADEGTGPAYDPGEECGYAGDYHLPDVVECEGKNALLIRKMLKGEGGNVSYIGSACFVITVDEQGNYELVDWWVEDPEGIKFTND